MAALADAVQFGLDIIGLIPGLGEIADGLNGLISLARGDYAGAALSFAAMIPFAGWAATAGKLGKRAVNAVDAVGDSTRAATKYGDEASSVVGAASKNADQAAQIASNSADEFAHATTPRARFEVTPSGVAIPTNPAELKRNLAHLQDVSTNPSSSRKFTGADTQGPVRVRVEKAHPADPSFIGTPDPLHTVDIYTSTVERISTQDPGIQRKRCLMTGRSNETMTRILWQDAAIDGIAIGFSEVVIHLRESTKKNTKVRCVGYIGYTLIGFWDETIVQGAELLETSDLQRNCLHSLTQRYGATYPDTGDPVRNRRVYRTLSVQFIDGSVLSIVAADFIVD